MPTIAAKRKWRRLPANAQMIDIELRQSSASGLLYRLPLADDYEIDVRRAVM
jgi:hypothetical protein